MPQITPGFTEEDERQRNLIIELQVVAARAAVVRWVALVVILSGMAAGWAFRWQVVQLSAGSGPSSAVVINRWTGEMRYLQGGNWLRLEELTR